MSLTSRVVWTEGMLLRPQHFQQHDRYMESRIEHRVKYLHAYGYGIEQMTIDADLLDVGQFALMSLTGVLQDGTPIRMPEDDQLPAPITVPQDTKDELLYLALPAYRPGTAFNSHEPDANTRYWGQEISVLDYNANDGAAETIEVGTLKAKLMWASEDKSGYIVLPVAKINHVSSNQQVILDREFIPPYLNALNQQVLKAALQETLGLIHQRAEALSLRLNQSKQGGTSTLADFLLLQSVNRYEPIIQHYLHRERLHPEALYCLLAELSGELATFISTSKRPTELPTYQHQALQDSIPPLMRVLQQQLSAVLEQTATNIPLEPRKFGIRVAPITDRGLLSTGQFVLAVKANMPSEELRQVFPNQTKIGPVELIRDLVNNQLPGIGLSALPVAPREIPYHAGYVYFQLDRDHALWQKLQQSGGFAFHLSGQFPDLALEFWGIKE